MSTANVAGLAIGLAAFTGFNHNAICNLEEILLGSYHQARAKLSQFDTEDEKESVRRYAKEAAAIKKGLFLTEEQMEDAKAKARKEFEKQTAGWD